jgi:hypothetical protein
MQADHLCTLQNLCQAQVNLLDAAWIIVQRRSERRLCPAVPPVSSTQTTASLACTACLICCTCCSQGKQPRMLNNRSWYNHTRNYLGSLQEVADTIVQIYTRVADFDEHVPAPYAHQYLVG